MSVMTITTADGETREVRTLDAYGVWECPFCGYPTLPGDTHPWEGPCANPACIVGGRGSVEEVARMRAEMAARATEADRQASITRSLSESRQRAAEQREELWEKVKTKAECSGACLTCLHYSPWQSGRPKFVTHRTPDFHERRNTR